MSGLYFIREGAVYNQPKIDYLKKDKAVFRSVLQTVDEVNRNKRRYRRSVLESGLLKAKGRMDGRSFYGELDHPIPTGNPTYDEIRQSVPLLSNSCLILRNYEFGGNNLVWGEMETLSNKPGRDLLGLLKDQVGIGLSLRGLAELRRMQEGFNDVQDPLVVICYDAVSNPSHEKATVAEVTFESTKLPTYLNKNSITESCNGSLICTKNGDCFLAEYFDRLVESRMIRIQESWF